jgi:hypothetical protein
MNRDYLTLAEECELAPKTEAQLSVVIDEEVDANDSARRRCGGRVSRSRYSVLAPF